ncbi:MAG TPA: PA domain-containing protein [Solirubrobacteraceae bacterium]|nr:PA domain-containing protein [Solirubrobacteraceae bacterium]
MRSKKLARAALAAASAVLLVSSTAFAHEVSRLADDGAIDSGKETHYHDDAQHGTDEGHLPPTSRNVRKVSNLDLFAPGEEPGRIADVSAKGNYAYLTAFYEPDCDRGGVYIVDISNPAAPKKVSLIPSHLGTYSGEGSQVVTLNTPSFKGDLLVYQNEICPGSDRGVGGVTLVDVTNPRSPKKLVEGFGDFTVAGKSQTHSNETHSAFAWQDGGKAYAVLVDDEEATDVDILDITNPSRPKLISETDLTAATQQPLGAVHGDAVFHHDMVVKEIDGRQTMLVSYWDGGYVKLDVEDPANPKFIADTDFAMFDPVRLEVTGGAQAISPEGNGHEAEFTRDNRYFLATDEDFNPYRVTASMGDGTAFTAIQGSDVPQIDDHTTVSGDTRAVGLACDAATIPAADAGHPVAVIERGVCDFTVKVQNVQAAGYSSAIVFNRTGIDGCETLISMLVEAGIPAVFVSRTDGFRILTGSVPAGYTCDESGAGTAAPAVGTDGQTVDIRAVFDGWGYVHQYDASTMQDVDQYYVPESQDPAYADGFGDLSVHEVATDPDRNLGYISYYGAGFRVVSYGAGGMREVGRYIDEGGNNFWGVEVHKHPNGQKYVLASDRDSGVYLFQYTG